MSAELHQMLLGKNVFAKEVNKKKVRWFEYTKATSGKIVAVWLVHSRNAEHCPAIWIAIVEDETGEMLTGPLLDFNMLSDVMF
jgi:hypothetical protein